MVNQVSQPTEVSLMVDKYLTVEGEVSLCLFMFAVTVRELEQKSNLDKARRLVPRLRNYAASHHFTVNATKLQKEDIEKMIASLQAHYGV